MVSRVAIGRVLELVFSVTCVEDKIVSSIDVPKMRRTGYLLLSSVGGDISLR